MKHAGHQGLVGQPSCCRFSLQPLQIYGRSTGVYTPVLKQRFHVVGAGEGLLLVAHSSAPSNRKSSATRATSLEVVKRTSIDGDDGNRGGC